MRLTIQVLSILHNGVEINFSITWIKVNTIQKNTSSKDVKKAKNIVDIE